MTKAATKKDTKETKKTTVKDDAVTKETPRDYHVTQRKEDGLWQVKFAKGLKAIKTFATQKEAIEYAKHLAESQDGTYTIHKKDGKIRKQNYSK